MFVLDILFPIALLLGLTSIIYFGEKWHHWSIQHDRKILDDVTFPWKESQNPLWLWTLVIYVFGSTMLYSTVRLFPLVSFEETTHLWIAVINLVICLAMMLVTFLFCGMSLEVDREQLKLFLGPIKIRLLTIHLSEIDTLEVRQFSPLFDFGGWGFRYGRKGVKGYFMSGNHGVFVTTNHQKPKKYLIGSDHPEQLLQAIQLLQAMMAQKNENG